MASRLSRPPLTFVSRASVTLSPIVSFFGLGLSFLAVDFGFALPFFAPADFGFALSFLESVDFFAPPASADVAALCIKSGNCSILRGGSEAFNSNKLLANLFRETLKKNNHLL